MTDDQRTIAQLNTNRSTYRTVARVGFVLAPAMFFLPLIYPMVTGQWHWYAVICMTAAFAVLVSASSFAAMANTPLDGNPRRHQLWAVPVAVGALAPGGVISFSLYAAIVSTLNQAGVGTP